MKALDVLRNLADNRCFGAHSELVNGLVDELSLELMTGERLQMARESSLLKEQYDTLQTRYDDLYKKYMSLRELEYKEECKRFSQDQGLMESLRVVLRDHGKIPAIKMMRDKTKFGVKETKDFVEAQAEQNKWVVKPRYDRPKLA